MSFTPGEGSERASIAAAIGSGITVGTVSGVDYVSANLIAGAGVSIVPSTVDTSITISSTGGGGGIASVTSANGSGITATTVGSAVSLTSALVAGADIGLTQSSITKALTINNLQTTSTASGCGITAIKTGSNTALAANLTAGNGISIVNSGINTSKQISNSGVLSVIAGTGISVNQATGNTTITNTGLTGLTSANAGTNITISGTASAPIINASSPSTNDGVRFNVPQTLTRPTLFGSTFDPVSIFTIPIPPAMQSCNVFTMYIRTMSFLPSVSSTTFRPDYRVYLSDQVGSATTGSYDPNEGCMNSVEFNDLTNQPYDASNVIWNFRPSQSAPITNLYFNGFKYDGSASSAFGMSEWVLTFDLIGQRMQLE